MTSWKEVLFTSFDHFSLSAKYWLCIVKYSIFVTLVFHLFNKSFFLIWSPRPIWPILPPRPPDQANQTQPPDHPKHQATQTTLTTLEHSTSQSRCQEPQFASLAKQIAWKDNLQNLQERDLERLVAKSWNQNVKICTKKEQQLKIWEN